MPDASWQDYQLHYVNDSQLAEDLHPYSSGVDRHGQGGGKPHPEIVPNFFFYTASTLICYWQMVMYT